MKYRRRSLKIVFISFDHQVALCFSLLYVLTDAVRDGAFRRFRLWLDLVVAVLLLFLFFLVEVAIPVVVFPFLAVVVVAIPVVIFSFLVVVFVANPVIVDFVVVVAEALLLESFF